tara:strand:- start:40689 stop:40922 length:234 start_codon:yes stop_codon:yes gene_type:complete
LQSMPATSFPSGLSILRRTPNVSLAASNTRSTAITSASYSPPIGAAGITLAIWPISTLLKSSVGKNTSIWSGSMRAI